MSCCNKYAKSTLDTYTSGSTTLITGASVPFASNYISTGASISHIAGNTTINLEKSGLYLIIFNCSFTATSTTGATAKIQLYRNGVAVPSAFSTEISASGSDLRNMNFSSLIEVDNVCCCSGNGSSAIPLTFVNVLDGIVTQNIKVDVIKLA